MSAIGSGSPRGKMSRWNCGRFISRFGGLAESPRAGCSRLASAVAISSALGPSGVARFRQQQPRFQVGEPRRHHEIVGGKLEAELSRRLDEREILVGQRQDRDLGEIDLLLARQRQQQVERAFKPSTSTTSAGSSSASSAGRPVSNDQNLRASCASSCPVHQRVEFGRAPPADRAAAAACATASAAAARSQRPRRPVPASRAATVAHLVELAVAMQDHVAAGRDDGAGPLGDRSRQRVHGHVITHQQTLEPDYAANHFADHCRRSRRRLGGVERA